MAIANKGKEKARFYATLTRNRIWVVVITLVITAISAVGLKNIQSEVILTELFPYDHPYVKLAGNFSKVFGGGGTTTIIAVSKKQGDIFNIETMQKVKDMVEEINSWKEVYRQLTASIASQSAKVVNTHALGEISASPLMWPDVPSNEQEMKTLRDNILSSSQFNGVMVATDGSATSIIAEIKEDIAYGRAYELLSALKAKYADSNTEIHVVGFPMLMGYVQSLKPEMRLLFLTSIGLMIVIMIFIFRSFKGMLTPMIVGLISTVIGIGCIGWTGINFSPLMYVLAFLVGARIVSHAVQITHRYFEELTAVGNDRLKACTATMRAMFVPNVAGVTTDIAGFSVLYFAKIILMKNIAVIMSCWMFSVCFSAILTPIICSYLPVNKLIAEVSRKRVKHDGWDKILMGLTRVAIGPRGRYALILLIMGVIGFCGVQGARIKTGDATPGSPLLWSNHPYNQDQEFINSKFKASSETFVLYYDGEPGSIYDPNMNLMLQKFDNYMAETLPDIYKFSSSALDFSKLLNLTFHDGDLLYNEVPRNEVALLGNLGSVKTQIGIGNMRRYWDDEFSKTQITLFFADHTADNLIRISDAARAFFQIHPMKLEKGEFRLAGGGVGQEIALNQEIKESHTTIDTIVLCTILLMCMICFRSVVGGIMLTVPLIIANMGAFAYMVVMDIGLSVNTLPIAAVGVGVGVDFAIYFYSRCIEEYPVQNDWVETIMVSIRTCGKAIVFTGITLILPIIPWYFFSTLKFQAQMGFFLSMLLLGNMFLALTLHPLMILLIKPKFIQQGVKERVSACH